MKDRCNPMRAKLICVSCYLRGKKGYMMQASAFGVTRTEEFYAKYVAQGCWARCLQCQKEANAPFANPTVSFSERSRSAPSSGLACRICSANASNKPWKESLECNSHGCSRCLHTFPEDHWSKAYLNSIALRHCRRK